MQPMLITNRHANPTNPAFFDSPAYTNTPVKSGKAKTLLTLPVATTHKQN